MSPAAMNATITLTTEVESLMGTLCDLLDRESDAVRVADFASFKSVQDDKFAMLTRYRSLMDTLQRQTGTLKSADARVLDRLRASADRFKKAADRNAQALEAGRNSMQRIVDRIVRTARETVHANRQTYTQKGKSGMPQSVSIQVNEVL